MVMVLLGIFMDVKVRVGFRVVAMRVQMHALGAAAFAQHVDTEDDQHQRH